MNRHRTIMLALLCTAQGAAANTPADYATTFPIDTSAAAGGSSAWRFELTPAAYRWSHDAALRDIEVFNAAGAPVPLAPWTAASAVAQASEASAALPLFALPAQAPGTQGDIRVVIDSAALRQRIDIGEHAGAPARDLLLDARAFDHPLERIELDWDTPAAGIVARFAVDIGDDMQRWRGIGTATVLALEQDGARLERRAIALDGQRAKYLRLRRLDDGADLGGLRARAFATTRSNAPTAQAWLDATLAHGTDAPPPGITRYHYTLAAALPVDALRIELANDNALAPLLLSTRDAARATEPWTDRAHITAFRLRSGTETLRNDDVDLAAGPRVRELRIEARAPLAAAPRVSVRFRPQAFVFLAEGAPPYTLAVGSARARRATYPVDVALASLRAQLGKNWQPPLATLGAARQSAGAAALATPTPPLPWRRWLLWAVLVAGAALVGGFALSLLRGSRS